MAIYVINTHQNAISCSAEMILLLQLLAPANKGSCCNDDTKKRMVLYLLVVAKEDAFSSATANDPTAV
jgi:hypothetical protein